MSLKIIFDETHHEIFSNYNCLKFSAILKKFSIISFRLVFGPITLDNLEGTDILFIGAPRDSFSKDEINTILQYIMDDGFLIIVCNSSRNNSLNINSLSKFFNIRFDFNHIKDPEHHWKDAIYFPLIKDFNKSPITKNINKLIYSGSTLTLLSDDCIPVAFTSKTSIPPTSPIIATSFSGRCLVIGGSTMFYDDEFGISAGQNSMFISNILKYFIYAKKYPNKLLAYQKIPTPTQKSVHRRIPLKKAMDILNKKIKDAFSEYKKIYNEIDKYMQNIINLIKNKKLIEAKNTLSLKYKEIQNNIISKQLIIFDIIERLEPLVNDISQFNTFKNEILNEFYVNESDVNKHLDMIYGRLKYYIENPEAIP